MKFYKFISTHYYTYVRNAKYKIIQFQILLCHFSNVLYFIQTNSYNSTRQDAGFNLEKYDPYLDKIRAFFVPSLERKVHSLLEEFVYRENSRWTEQFLRFKKFINAIIMREDFLNDIAECDMEKLTKTVKCIMRDELAICLLDSVLLHRRLNKICYELDTLGIEDDILRSLDYRKECNHFMYASPILFAHYYVKLYSNLVQ